MLNKFSKYLTQPKKRGGAQSMLYALGLTRADMNKPQIGICSMWYDGNPCNSKLNVLTDNIKRSIVHRQFLPMRFNTIGVSDGMSMGTFGMKYSLLSRDLIADSIETVVQAQHYDGLICVPGCDKNLPGAAMALLRLNRPGCIIYGGSMRPQIHDGKRIDIVSAFESYGKFLNKQIDNEKRQSIVENACDSKKCGSCSGLYTANTMACILEVMGLSLPNSSSNLSLSDEKLTECDNTGNIMKMLLEKDLKPRDIVTHKSFMNAIKFCYVIGGSTNAIIHLLAMAKDADVSLTIDDCKRVQNTPVLLNMKPHGEFCMSDLYEMGGTKVLCKYLIEKGVLDGTTQTVTGKTLWENVRDAEPIVSYSPVIYPLEKPFKKTSHIRLLKGNLAPDGCISKVYSEKDEVSGTVIAFDSEADMLDALAQGRIQEHHFVVLRYQGESVGCPEMLTPTSALVGYFGKATVPPFATDGRFSGGSTGLLVAHLPDAFKENSPTAKLRNGDVIRISLNSNTINVEPYRSTTNDNESFEMRVPRKKEKTKEEQTGILGRYSRFASGFERGYTMN